MPAQEKAFRNQKAVYWKATGAYSSEAEVLVKEAIELDVRWEQTTGETLVVDNNTVDVDAEILVDRIIPNGSILWLGALTDLIDPPTSLRQVVASTEIPDLKAREFFRSVIVIRYRDELPTIVG